MKAYRWFPEGAVVFKFEEASGFEVGIKVSPKPHAVGYFGKAAKHSFNYTFRDVERMDIFLDNRYQAGIELAYRRASRKEERRAAAKAPNPLKVGDVLLNSWGYDQTNADFYEVVAMKGKRSVVIREIACESIAGSEGFMSDRVKPVPGAFLEKAEPMVKRVTESGSVKIHDWGSYARKFEGNATYRSWYA